MTLYRNEIAHADRDEHRYPHTEWDPHRLKPHAGTTASDQTETRHE